MGWQVILWIATLVVSYALRPKPDTPARPTLGDIQAPTAEVGSEIPVLFGTREIKAPNVVWYGDMYLHPVKKKSGKKG